MEKCVGGGESGETCGEVQEEVRRKVQRVWGEVRGGRGMGVRGNVLGCGGDMGEGVGRGERKGGGVEKCRWGMCGCEVWGDEGR